MQELPCCSSLLRGGQTCPNTVPSQGRSVTGPLHLLCHGMAAGMVIVSWLSPLCSDAMLQVLLWSQERSNV